MISHGICSQHLQTECGPKAQFRCTAHKWAGYSLLFYAFYNEKKRQISFTYIMPVFFLSVWGSATEQGQIFWIIDFFISALIFLLYKDFYKQPAWYFRNMCHWTQHFILRQLIQKLWMFSVSMSSKYHHRQDKEYLEKHKESWKTVFKLRKKFSLSSFFSPWISLAYYTVYSVQQFFWNLLLSREDLKGKISGIRIVTNSYGIFGLCFIVVGIRHSLLLRIFFRYFYCLAGISNMRKARVS